MTEKKILQALQKAVIDAVTAVNNTNLPSSAVKYMGRDFKIPNNGKWLEVINIPNNIQGDYWDDSKTYRGIFRLILYWSMNDKGIYEPLDLLTQIHDHFTKGTKFYNSGVTVRITENPNLLNIDEIAPQLIFYTSIRYNSFVQST